MAILLFVTPIEARRGPQPDYTAGALQSLNQIYSEVFNELKIHEQKIDSVFRVLLSDIETRFEAHKKAVLTETFLKRARDEMREALRDEIELLTLDPQVETTKACMEAAETKEAESLLAPVTSSFQFSDPEKFTSMDLFVEASQLELQTLSLKLTKEWLDTLSQIDRSAIADDLIDRLRHDVVALTRKVFFDNNAGFPLTPLRIHPESRSSTSIILPHPPSREEAAAISNEDDPGGGEALPGYRAGWISLANKLLSAHIRSKSISFEREALLRSRFFIQELTTDAQVLSLFDSIALEIEARVNAIKGK